MLLFSSGVYAETLCYRSGTDKTGSDNAVRAFKGSVCPKGFRRIERSILGRYVAISELTGQPGDAGPQGLRGAEGAAGPKGVAGARGDTGEAGERGDAGLQGAKGPDGTAGLQGEVGPNGVNGINGFNFHGSTGASSVIASDNTADFWSIGDVDGPSTSKGNSEGEIYTLMGNTCSKLELTLSVATAPGLGKSWKARIGISLPNGTAGVVEACTIADGAQSCTAALQGVQVAQFPPNAMIRFGIVPVGAPTPVKAAWNVRCVAA
jgi:hypothetical protein